jgi:hypothetical protein
VGTAAVTLALLLAAAAAAHAGQPMPAARTLVRQPSAAQRVPEVAVSPREGPPGTVFTYSGRGFTGESGAISHLVRADRIEAYRAKRFPTTAEGTFERPIDSADFPPGTYTVWAMDESTKAETARVTFEVVSSRR